LKRVEVKFPKYSCVEDDVVLYCDVFGGKEIIKNLKTMRGQWWNFFFYE
jgi:hypothetical protein